MSIEENWRQLLTAAGGNTQTRVDATHPLDLYADLQPPDRIGLVAICGSKPPEVRPMRALTVDVAKRSDGRWTLRLSLLEQQLAPVFAALCRDVIACSRAGVDEFQLGRVVVQRLVHWRSLLEREATGLGDPALRGLIGELLVLRDKLLPIMPLAHAVAAWRGPLGAPQDFVLPSGDRIEVKTVNPYADQVTIHGLAQLDSAGDPLTLIIVRGERVHPGSPSAVSAASLVADLRELLVHDPEARQVFDTALNGLGWHDHPEHEALAMRFMRMDLHTVGPDFPKLTRANVPEGLMDADYTVSIS